MRLYLVNKNQIYKFNLPQKIDGSFLFSYLPTSADQEDLINIDAIDGQWKLKSNGNVNIVSNNTYLEEMILSDFSVVPLASTNTKTYSFLYCLPTIDSNTKLYSLSGVDRVAVGSGNDNQVIYRSSFLLNNHAVFAKKDANWYLTPLSQDTRWSIFLNDSQVIKETLIQPGDIIFVAGLKIIWMNTFFKINQPYQQVFVKELSELSLPEIENTSYKDPTDDELMRDLYHDDDYFSHTPRIRSVLEPVTIQVDAPPPNQNDQDDLPFLLTIGTSLVMVGSSFMTGYNVVYGLASGKRNVLESLPMIIMCVTMIIGVLVMPRIMKNYQKKKKKEREQLRQIKYGEYLQRKENEIQVALKKQSQILIENNLDLSECLRLLNQPNQSIWNREITDRDFLTVRLGIGNCPSQISIQAPEEHFSLDEDNLHSKVFALHEKYKTLEHVPITFSFTEELVTSLILDSSFNDDYVNGILLQLVTFHSALDLKIVILTNSEKEKQWDYAKYLPHCWNEDKSMRFFATTPEEVKQVSSFLEKEFVTRKEQYKEKVEKTDKTFAKFTPYYLVITDNFKDVRSSVFIEDFLGNDINYGFSLVILEKSLKNLPKECSKFAYICNTVSGIFDEEVTEQSSIKFTAEYSSFIQMREVSKKLANIPIQSREMEHEFPSVISFLEMYNVGKIEQLNIVNRWQLNDPTTSLQAAVGVHKNGDLFKLDLHEKADGPHGLIAGSTGSGKSEFIITYILSMAVNYHPDEVQFVLIDYKGGGLAGAFENRETGVEIPHLAGTITNLDTASMNRTLVSIESELRRRQQKFNEVREKIGESTMDIYKYQRLYREGVIDEPISHLFIISDEFAELKSQQPDFMAQLISTARIGRSLGVHLILATQKPSGVVNDQIWSNSRFKVCLKVQSRADSMEMLKRPEAASLKQIGRFYLQVGYDEYFDIGQSAWTGAKYLPTERIIKKIDQAVYFVENTGSVIKSISDINKTEVSAKNGSDQLTSLVRYLADIAKRDQLVSHSLWLPALENEILLAHLREKYSYKTAAYYINPIVGEYDAPKMQQQGLFILDFTNDGNTLIYGMPGSGKENLLSTIIYSIVLDHTPEEINFYIADFGSETLKVFQKLPHVGDVFVTEESDKLNSFLQMLDREMERRKKLFSDYAGSYQEYCKSSGNKEPMIMVIINSFENFQESYPRLQDSFDSYLRDGVKYGIVFVVTTAVSSSVRMRLAQNFLNKICLRMPETTSYRDLLGAPRGLVPVDNFGRGIFGISGVTLEFQTANICPLEEKNQFLKEMIEKYQQKYSVSAKKIPVLPNIVYVDDIFYEMKGLHYFPIGIERTTLEVYVYDFTINKINLISAKYLSNHIYFIYGLIAQMLRLEHVHVKVIDAMGVYKGTYPSVEVYNQDFNKVLLQIDQQLIHDASQEDMVVYFFLGIGEMKDKVSEEYQVYFQKIFQHDQYQKNIFIFADDYTSLKKIQVEDWYRANVDNTFGIWLGEDVGTQIAISAMALSISDKQLVFPCIAFPIYKGNHMIIKYVVDGVEKENEE